jgi:hypothetical protein
MGSSPLSPLPLPLADASRVASQGLHDADNRATTAKQQTINWPRRAEQSRLEAYSKAAHDPVVPATCPMG